jgi:hypothetical protein
MPRELKERIVQVGLRIPDGLRERLEKAARRNGQSLNAEMVRRLETSFDVVSNEEFVRMRTQFTQFISLLTKEQIEREKKLRDK